MLPTRDQIETAAYHRWLRRHGAHGYDRDDWIGSQQELTYTLNYETIIEHALDSPDRTILGSRGPCRFCERTTPLATFSRTRPVVQRVDWSSLFSAQVCDECQEESRDSLAEHCEDFWSAVRDGAETPDRGLASKVDLLAVFKSLVGSALLIMPEDELGYFPDTLEWANNPDHEFDRAHFADSHFVIYRAPFLANQSWIQLARRIDHEVPFPYMLVLVACHGLILQMSVPMCVRDQDLEGRTARMPKRSLIDGEGPRLQQARTSILWLGAGRGPRGRGHLSENAYAVGLAMV